MVWCFFQRQRRVLFFFCGMGSSGKSLSIVFLSEKQRMAVGRLFFETRIRHALLFCFGLFWRVIEVLWGVDSLLCCGLFLLLMQLCAIHVCLFVAFGICFACWFVYLFVCCIWHLPI